MERQLRSNSAECDDRTACTLYTVADVANMLLLPIKMIHKLVREKKLACVQLTPRIRRFTPEQVQQYIDSHSSPVPIDKKASRPVSSPAKKGRDTEECPKEKTEDSWASLQKEMSKWT